MKRVSLIWIVMTVMMVSPFYTSAQNKILDGVYIKENTPTRRVIPYTQVREADVMWLKRVWRTLDLKQKQNHTIYYPVDEIMNRKSLFDVIKFGIQEGTITAYGDPVLDDEFKLPLTKTEAIGSLSAYEKYFREDEATGELFEDSVPVDVTSGDIKQYWIKEEWFFDRERSVLDVRILGIAPVQEKLDPDDNISVKGMKPLFWVYFPEARYVFANFDVFNTFNDAERRTYEDIFWKRTFASYVREESNVYDRALVDYKVGIDILLESEKIKTKIFNYEHDLWHF